MSVFHKQNGSGAGTGRAGKSFSLLPYLWQYKWHYLVGVILLTAVDMANLYIPQYTGEMIDGLAAGAFGMAQVRGILLKLLFVGIVIMVGRFGWRYFIIGASRGVERNIRNDLFAHVETLSAGFFNHHKTGDLMAHFTNDLGAIRMAVGFAVITAFDAVAMTFMVLFKMIFHVSLKLTVLAFVPLILVAVGCYFYGVESKKRQTRRQEAFSALSDKVQESLSGIRVQKAFVQEEADFASIEAAGQECMKRNLSVVKLRMVFGPTLDLITGISMLFTLVFGGKMVLDGKVSIGQFVAFQSYIGMLVWPMIACGDCINTFSQAAAAFGRVREIFAAEPEITEPPLPLIGAEEVLTGDIVCDRLTFTYPGAQAPVLQDISLHIAPGEMLGILGRTGSGKSTFANLLLRVYDCSEGMLKIDNTPLNRISLTALHKNIAYVPQDNFLFSDTLEENIAFGLEERISEHPELSGQIIQAAKDACIHDNIIDFPEGYQTLVGERGVTLSGGQKQRSSIARALLMQAPILILDDSLSAVDTDTEEKILENILRLRKGKTTIIIAHRISTLQHADHIAVLSDGLLSEYGTHDELLQKGGFYANIYEKQQLEQELTAM